MVYYILVICVCESEQGKRFIYFFAVRFRIKRHGCICSDLHENAKSHFVQICKREWNSIPADSHECQNCILADLAQKCQITLSCWSHMWNISQYERGSRIGNVAFENTFISNVTFYQVFTSKFVNVTSLVKNENN